MTGTTNASGAAASAALLRTPLHEVHRREGGKIVDFAGWEMPVQYSGIQAEHQAVRTGIGLFDLSHMGEIEVTGPDAEAFVNRLVTNDVSKLAVGQALYTCMCRPDGKILDDLLVYRFEQKFWLVVNASNRDKDMAWIEGQKSGDVQVRDLSLEIALLAVQGPTSQAFLQPFTRADLDAIPYYHFVEGEVDGIPMVISRTGYTGEDGFELYCPWDKAEQLWTALRKNGEIVPIGLGARDTLRLESGYALYGHEIDEETTPLDAGLGWVVKFGKADFLGKEALQRQKEEGVRKCLVGLEITSRGIPRQGYPVETADGPVGVVTSGTFSPSLARGIALASVETAARSEGTELFVSVRGRREPARLVRPPFVKGSVRRG